MSYPKLVKKNRSRKDGRSLSDLKVHASKKEKTAEAPEDDESYK